MNLPVEILKKMYPLEPGGVYWGGFAHDGSNHMAILIHVTETKAFLFCIDSQDGTRKHFSRIDKDAVVCLTTDEQRIYFSDNGKTSFLYCGKAGICQRKISDFYQGLSDRSIVVKEKASVALTERVLRAIDQSITLSQQDKVDLGFVF